MINAPFIVIEGIDGAGTTTQARMLCESLRGQGLEPVQTGEPTRTRPIGSLIRKVLTREVAEPNTGFPWSPDERAMALLFAADRLDHLRGVVEPALQAGMPVVTDRYYHSSLTYHPAAASQAFPVDPAWVRALNAAARQPDVTFVLRVSPDVAAQRRAARGGQPERYERTVLQERLATAYDRLPELLPNEPLLYINGDHDREHVAERIWVHVVHLLNGGRIAPGAFEDEVRQ